MIALAQTPSTHNSSRGTATPSQYQHFRRILKTRQKFPTSAEQQTRQTPSTAHRRQNASVQIRIDHTPMSGLKDRKAKCLERQQNYYSLYNLPYKNYKYVKPPGDLNVEQYLEGTLKLAQTLGVWDRQLLNQKLGTNNQKIRISLKDGTYSSDHLMRSVKPQGPSSCLETIYIAKIELDDEQNQEKDLKKQALEEKISSQLNQESYKYPSQSYTLNRWTRSAQNCRSCYKQELLPKVSFQRSLIDQSISDVRKSIESVINSQYSTIITELPQAQTFFKFDARQNSNKQQYLQKGQTVGQLQDNFEVFKKPIIGDRLLLSLQLQPNKLDMKVPFKVFQQFLLIFINKKGNLKQMIDGILDFFNIDGIISCTDFTNLMRIICEQFKTNHPNTQNLFNQLIENFKIAGVIKDIGQIDIAQFKGIFIANQMNINDLIELIVD